MAFDAMSFVEHAPKDFKELKDRDDKDFWVQAMEMEWSL